MFDSIDENALNNKWPAISEKLALALEGRFESFNFATQWPNEIRNFLILLRLLPFKSSANSKASTETFLNSTKRLLLFSEVLTHIFIIVAILQLIFTAI